MLLNSYHLHIYFGSQLVRIPSLKSPLFALSLRKHATKGSLVLADSNRKYNFVSRKILTTRLITIDVKTKWEDVFDFDSEGKMACWDTILYLTFQWLLTYTKKMFSNLFPLLI